MLTTQITLEDAQKSIKEIEDSLLTDTTTLHHMFISKQDAVRFLAECYEVLIYHEKIDMKENQIANFLVKKLSKLDSKISQTHIYDNLPAKYKEHKLNPLNDSENRNDNSSLNTKDYTEENQNEIKFIEQQIHVLKLRISKLKVQPYLSQIDPEIYREHFIIKNTALKLMEDAMDDRKTIPLNTIHLLLDAYDTANLKYAAGEYISLLKKFGAQKKDESIKILKQFSPKQLGKILRGHVREIHQSMEIHTQAEAYENGFYGKCPCPECGSWRVNLESQYDPITDTFADPSLYCYKCGQISPKPMAKLPLSQPTPQITESNTI